MRCTAILDRPRCWAGVRVLQGVAPAGFLWVVVSTACWISATERTVERPGRPRSISDERVPVSTSSCAATIGRRSRSSGRPPPIPSWKNSEDYVSVFQ